MVTTAVILAAGLGSRLKGRTRERPKAFLEIDGKSLIRRSVDNLLQAGITKIVIGTGYLSECFDALKSTYPMITTVKNEDFALTGSMYTLYTLRHTLTKDFLLLESDLLYEKAALSALTNDPRQDIILASGATHSNDEVYIEADDSKHLVNMSKTPEDLRHISGELTGLNKVSYAAYWRMCDYARARYATGDRALHYEDALVGIAGETGIFMKKINDLAWCEIDDEHHLTRARRLIYPKILMRDC